MSPITFVFYGFAFCTFGLGFVLGSFACAVLGITGGKK